MVLREKSYMYIYIVIITYLLLILFETPIAKKAYVISRKYLFLGKKIIMNYVCTCVYKYN